MAPALLHHMPHRLEHLHGRVAEAAALIERLIGQRLVMDPRCRDGVLQTHSLIEHVENDLRDRRDDRGTTRRADDQLEIAGAVEHNRRGHRRQHPFGGLNRVGLALHQTVHVWLTRRRCEVVHLVIQ